MPVIEKNSARRPHPGAEPIAYPLSTPPPEGGADAATIRAIKGKGVVATITPHFAVAVIVGVTTAFLSHKGDPVSENVGNEARRCVESVTQLRADFTQYKAEQGLANWALERKLNELLARTALPGQPSTPPSQLGVGVSRELSR